MLQLPAELFYNEDKYTRHKHSQMFQPIKVRSSDEKKKKNKR